MTIIFGILTILLWLLTMTNMCFYSKWQRYNAFLLGTVSMAFVAVWISLLWK